MFTYQFNYFLHYRLVDSNPEGIPAVMAAFNNEYLPSFFDEFTNLGQNKVVRLNGIGSKDGIVVLFGSDVLSIQINDTSNRIMDRDIILGKLNSVIECALRIKSDINSYRISSVITSTYQFESELCRKAYAHLFNEELDVDIFEWNLRKAKRINVLGNASNLVKSGSRAQIFNPLAGLVKPFDGLIFESDINTTQDDITPRFNIQNHDVINALHAVARTEHENFINAL